MLFCSRFPRATHTCVELAQNAMNTTAMPASAVRAMLWEHLVECKLSDGGHVCAHENQQRMHHVGADITIAKHDRIWASEY